MEGAPSITKELCPPLSYATKKKTAGQTEYTSDRPDQIRSDHPQVRDLQWICREQIDALIYACTTSSMFADWDLCETALCSHMLAGRDLYDTALAQHFITVNIISTIYDVDRDQFDECSIATSIPMHDGDDSASPHRFPLFFR